MGTRGLWVTWSLKKKKKANGAAVTSPAFRPPRAPPGRRGGSQPLIYEGIPHLPNWFIFLRRHLELHSVFKRLQLDLMTGSDVPPWYDYLFIPILKKKNSVCNCMHACLEQHPGNLVPLLFWTQFDKSHVWPRKSLWGWVMRFCPHPYVFSEALWFQNLSSTPLLISVCPFVKNNLEATCFTPWQETPQEGAVEEQASHSPLWLYLWHRGKTTSPRKPTASWLMCGHGTRKVH